MTEFPETQYAESDGLSIAYQVWGEGPNDLIFVPGIISHLEYFLGNPDYVHFMHELAKHFRLIVFDKRGIGMSDRITGAPSLDERIKDIEAVMVAANVERASLVGSSEGAPMAMLFAARNPEKVAKLILCGGYAVGAVTAGVLTEDELEVRLGKLRENWGKPDGEHHFTDTQLKQDASAEERAQFARTCRMCATPTTVAALEDMNNRIDVRAMLPTIQQPTLVLRREAEWMPRAASEGIANNIPGAIYRELPGSEHAPFLGNSGAYIDAIREFILGDAAPARAPTASQRVLASVLFTDIVGSTEQQVRLGDKAYRDLMNRHDELSKRQIENCNGRFVHGTGDGLLATFAAPTDAITCAIAIRDAVTNINLAVRAGVHTGEIELRGNDISGISVNIASRIADQAGDGEILTSDLTRQLMIGSSAIFDNRGDFELKGVPGSWPLFAASMG